MTLTAKLDDLGNPAWIALTVVGFLIWWPLGLLALGYLVGSGRMARWTGCGARRWEHEAQSNKHGCFHCEEREQTPPEGVAHDFFFRCAIRRSSSRSRASSPTPIT